MASEAFPLVAISHPRSIFSGRLAVASEPHVLPSSSVNHRERTESDAPPPPGSRSALGSLDDKRGTRRRAICHFSRGQRLGEQRRIRKLSWDCICGAESEIGHCAGNSGRLPLRVQVGTTRVAAEQATTAFAEADAKPWILPAQRLRAGVARLAQEAAAQAPRAPLARGAFRVCFQTTDGRAHSWCANFARIDGERPWG